MHPLARRDVIAHRQDSETVVLDPQARTYHLLHPLAAAVFHAADGTRDAAALRAAAESALGAPVDDAAVAAALARLDEAALLEGGVAVPTPAGLPGAERPDALTRRAAMRRLGLAAAGLALVTSIAAPSAASAVSGGPPPPPPTPFRVRPRKR